MRSTFISTLLFIFHNFEHFLVFVCDDDIKKLCAYFLSIEYFSFHLMFSLSVAICRIPSYVSFLYEFHMSDSTTAAVISKNAHNNSNSKKEDRDKTNDKLFKKKQKEEEDVFVAILLEANGSVVLDFGWLLLIHL